MKIIIAGAGEVGSHLAKMLSNESNDITVIDSDAARLETLASSADIITVLGDPSSLEMLKETGCETADLFIAVQPFEPQEVNIVSAMLAKKLGSKKVTARIDNEEYLSYENKFLFTEMGIDLMFYPEKIAAGEIYDLLKRTSSTDSMDFARGKLQMAVFKLDEDSKLIDKRLKDFAETAITDEQQFRVVALCRENVTMIPKYDTKFKANDRVFIISKREGIDFIMGYLGKSNIEVKNLMILGGSAIGEIVAKELEKEIEQIKIIEMDKDRCIELSEKLGDNVVVINGDGRNSDMLIEESIRDYDAFVAVTGSSETNILACVAAKRLGVSRTIAEVENLEYIRLAENMGVDAVINKKLITAGRIFKFTLSNKVRFVKYMSGTDAEVMEYVVAKNSRITKGKLREIDFPSDAVIGGVIRGNDSFIAVGDTEIRPYDRVAVFSLPQATKEVDKFFK